MRKTGILVQMAHALTFMRSTSCVVVMALLVLIVQPGPVQAQEAPLSQEMPRARIVEDTSRPRPANVEAGVSERLRAAVQELAQLAFSAEPDVALSSGRLDTLHERLKGLDREVNAGFDAVAALLGKDGLLQERHEEAGRQYREHMAGLFEGLSAAKRSRKPEAQRRALEALAALAKPFPEDRPHRRLDPRRLPVDRVKGTARKPGETPQDFQVLFKDLKVDVRARGPVPAAFVAPQPADLQPTEDVQITPEIQALAAELGNSPLAIYNWVHDNIEFVPTYGSIQGSRMTLLTRRGNAFDTASLLLAVLRDANVPARYVFGTMQMPVAKVSNWLGGTESPAVSQQLLGQGGVPNVGLLRNGELTHIRVEHVWVEAWVDYIPGRGVRPGPGDTWVPMDASFKAHDLAPDAGLLAAVPFDMTGVTAALLEGAQVDPALGRVTGMDANIGFDALEQWQQDLQQYAQANGVPSTQDALLGRTAIVPSRARVLPASLPYEVVVRASVVPVLPASLRLGVTLTGYASSLDRAFGSPSFTYHVSLPALGNKRLGLTFPPATSADAQIIETARANNASSLPVYLINVTPSVTLDGATVASGAAVDMGSAHFLDVRLEEPDGSVTVPYQVVAGDESVIGLNGDGIAAASVQDRFSRVPADTAAENMQQVALHYWSQCDALDALAAKGLKVHAVRRLSVGLFSTPLNVAYLFGTPRSGIYQSRIMDVQRSVVGVAGRTPDLTRAFVRSSGRSGSFLEGSVFDQIFNRPLGRGISAMQLLFDASLGGIPLYNVTSSNAAAVLPLLRVSSAIKADISTAVAQGKVVIVPESEIQHDNYRGVGYIVEDPETGAAAYLISGGLAGGGLFDCLPDLVPILVFILAIIAIAALLWWLWPVIVGGGVVVGGTAGAPALAAAILAFIGLFVTAGPAYASSGGGTGPCTCPPCPPNPPCEVDTTHTHWPCPGAHWHYRVYNQRPYPDCQCFLSGRLFGGCIPPPLPVPCPP